MQCGGYRIEILGNEGDTFQEDSSRMRTVDSASHEPEEKKRNEREFRSFVRGHSTGESSA